MDENINMMEQEELPESQITDDDDLPKQDSQPVSDEEPSKTSSASQQQSKPFLNPVDLQAMPIEIEFVLTRLNLPLSDIAQLTEGSIIPLDRDLMEPIDIVANGQAIGAGLLYQVGEQFGVKITDWRARTGV